MLTATREHVGDRSTDVYGLLLILIGVISGLAIYAGQAGPVGAFLEAIWRGLFGVFGTLMPIVLVGFGGLVVFDRPAPEVGRIGVGTTLVGLSLFGGWHLIAGSPHPVDGLRELWPAGGLVGWGVATPLEAGLSVWGAQAVFLVVLLLGLLIATGTPLATVIGAVRTWLTHDPARDRAAAGTKRRRRRRRARLPRTSAPASRTPSSSPPPPPAPDRTRMRASATAPPWPPPRPCRTPSTGCRTRTARPARRPTRRR